MAVGFSGLMQHMVEKHPDSQWFGDYGWYDDAGKAHMFCQICGEECTKEQQADEIVYQNLVEAISRHPIASNDPDVIDALNAIQDALLRIQESRA